jgi:hypothetical protein
MQGCEALVRRIPGGHLVFDPLLQEVDLQPAASFQFSHPQLLEVRVELLNRLEILPLDRSHFSGHPMIGDVKSAAFRFGFDVDFFEQLPEAFIADRRGAAAALGPAFGPDLALAVIELLHRQPTRLPRQTADDCGVSGRRTVSRKGTRGRPEADDDQREEECP